jgi:antitoxin FitA
MLSTCSIFFAVSKMIQIRNVPDDLHRSLKIRAAQRGVSLSDYLLSELEQLAEKPTIPELLERLRTRKSANVRESPAQVIRQHRES